MRDGFGAPPLPNPSIHVVVVRHCGIGREHSIDMPRPPILSRYHVRMRKGFCRPPSGIFPCAEGRWSLTLRLRATSARGNVLKMADLPRQSVAGWHGIIALVTIIELKCAARSLRSGPSGEERWKDKRAFSLSPPAARFARGAAATFLVDADDVRTS